MSGPTPAPCQGDHGARDPGIRRRPRRRSERGLAPEAFAVTNDGLRVFIQKGVLSTLDPLGVRRDIGILGADTGLLAVDGRRLFTLTAGKVTEWSTEPQPSNATLKSVSLTPGAVPVALVATSGTVFVAAREAIYAYASFDAPPVVIARRAIAMTAKPDGTALYALDPAGVVHAIDPITGQDNHSYTLRAGGAIAYALSANRLFVARTDTPSIDVIDLEGGAIDTVPLANSRTGAFTTGATALASSPARNSSTRYTEQGRGDRDPWLLAIRVDPREREREVPGDRWRRRQAAVAGCGQHRADRDRASRPRLALPGVLFGGVLAFFSSCSRGGSSSHRSSRISRARPRCWTGRCSRRRASA